MSTNINKFQSLSACHPSVQPTHLDPEISQMTKKKKPNAVLFARSHDLSFPTELQLQCLKAHFITASANTYIPTKGR